MSALAVTKAAGLSGAGGVGPGVSRQSGRGDAVVLANTGAAGIPGGIVAALPGDHPQPHRSLFADRLTRCQQPGRLCCCTASAGSQHSRSEARRAVEEYRATPYMLIDY